MMSETNFTQFFKRLGNIVKASIPPAFKTCRWLLSLMIPISLGVTILNYTGILGWLAHFINPLFHLIGLPGQCSLAYLTGIFLNVYSAIAVISTLSLTIRQTTIIALMVLIAHNLIVETVIQKKTGSSTIKIILIRVVSSIVGAIVLNLLLPPEIQKTISETSRTISQVPLIEVLKTWGVNTLLLSLKIIVFINTLMILQKMLEEFGILKLLSKVLSPFMRMMGLPANTSFLWIVANFLGLAYGGAIMIEQLERKNITTIETDILNHHTAVSHSQLEDTLLFVTIGVPVLWIMVPRVIMAIIIVWFYRFWLYKTKDVSMKKL